MRSVDDDELMAKGEYGRMLDAIHGIQSEDDMPPLKLYAACVLVLLALLAAICLVGCAGRPYRLPCEFDAHVLIDTEDGANQRCHEDPGLVDDNGWAVDKDDKVHGCANSSDLISRAAQETMGHELNHMLEKNCPQ